jgi:TatD DNase family protein
MMKQYLIDTHCHLHYDYSPKNVETLIEEAQQKKVLQLITVATDIASLPLVEKIATKHTNVFFTSGIHPHDVKDLTADSLNVIEQYAKHPKCVAIGEIGLDTYYENSDIILQKEYFQKQLLISKKIQKPVVIHARGKKNDGTENELIQLLVAEKAFGVIHCFTGSNTFGLSCLEAGFYLSFSGIITFKTAQNLRDFITQIPLTKILIETDAPFLAPIPYRGKKCEPSMVAETAACIAMHLNLPLSTIIEKTTENATRLFKLPPVVTQL